MLIRKARKEEYPLVRDFYYTLTDAMQKMEYKPGWQKDIYPAQEFLRDSIEKGEMYIAEENGKILSCMVVNHEYNEEYEKVRWSVDAARRELFVIHALGVDAEHAGKGIAKRMVQEVIEMAQKNRIKTIRLDVLEENLPAEKVYVKMGFRYVDTLRMFYEDTGYTNFKIFEYTV